MFFNFPKAFIKALHFHSQFTYFTIFKVQIERPFGPILKKLFPGGFGGLANYGIEVGTCRTGYVEVNFYQSERQITEAIYFRKLLADAKISYREVPPLADVARDFARQPVQKSGFYKGLLRQVRKSKNSKGRRKG